MKAAMVLFSIEQGLGQYVTENSPDIESIPESLRQTVADRSNDGVPHSTVAAVVQSTYISETIDAAIAISRHASDHPHLSRLKELATCLRLYDIRNAVCHPNRPFPECYWHRISAIATDPALESLQLRQVSAAFRAAEEGKLIGPPDTWFNLRLWAVPNNLPYAIDHEITGLVGRTKELNDLMKKMANPRFTLLALVGPGGTGKTALCLEALHTCSRDPATLEWADELLFATAKSERLTATGVESITDPIDSIESLKQVLAAALSSTNDIPQDTTFEVATKLLRDRRILICIDNLETVVRDHPAAFDEFYADLPTAWRVLITSRVVVNSATVIPVDGLAAAAGKNLCRQYIAKRGGPRLGESVMDRIVDSCTGTPLAIRLVIDSYLAGAELETALRTTRDNVIAFSYSGLLAALPSSSNDVLECLFAANDIIGRDEIGSLLDFDADQVADGITALIRTSLVTRHTSLEQEQYSLSSSVRELLLRSPVNPAVRGRVHEGLRNQTQAIQSLIAVGRKDPLSWDHVPDDSPKHVKAIAFEAFGAIRKRSARDVLLKHLDKVKQHLGRQEKTPVLSRVAGYLYNHLDDRASAVEMFKVAWETHKDLPAAISLAETFHEERRLEEAIAITSRLIDGGWGDDAKSSPESSNRLLKVHWVASIWIGKLKEAIVASEDWINSGKRRATLACINASAKKRLLEKATDGESSEGYIQDILFILDSVFRMDGYIGFVAHEALNALGQIAWNVERHSISPKSAALLCRFVDLHLPEVCAVHRVRSLDDSEVVAWIKTFQSLDCEGEENVLQKEKWTESLSGLSDPGLEEKGYIPVAVYAPPMDLHGMTRSYLFAQDEDGTQYYVPRRATPLSYEEFSRIKKGEYLFVLPSHDGEGNGDGEKAISVRDALLS